jgi:hypothetical protein
LVTPVLYTARVSGNVLAPLDLQSREYGSETVPDFFTEDLRSPERVDANRQVYGRNNNIPELTSSLDTNDPKKMW